MNALKWIGYILVAIALLAALLGAGAILAAIGAASGAIALGFVIVTVIAACLKSFFETKDT